MPSQTASPLADLHTHSLSFSLDPLDSLTSAQVALVPFHPDSTPLIEERAKLVFARRRAAWLEGERARIKQEELDEEERRQAQLRREEQDRVRVVRDERPVEVKKGVEEISLLDDEDDDELEVVPRADKGKGKAKEHDRPLPPKKRKSDGVEASTSSRPGKASKRPSLDGAGPTARRVCPPPPPPPVLVQDAAARADKVRQMRSFRRTQSNPQAPAPPLPFSLPGLGAPAADVAPLPVSASTSSSAPFSIDALLRLPHSPPRTASPPALPAPAFVPNHGARLEREHSWLPAFVLHTHPGEDPNSKSVYHPPPPDPEFTPMPAHVDEDPDGLAPLELRKRLTTVRFDGLSPLVSCELLFRFLVRGQRRLRPRPLAMRKEAIDEESSEGDYGQKLCSFLLAFRSVSDAQATVDDNNGRQMPDLEEDERCISASIVAHPDPPVPGISSFDPVFSALTVKPAPPRTAAESAVVRKKALDEELALGWKWGELSDEVRAAWRKYDNLPTSRMCPPRDAGGDDSEHLISEEYTAELAILTLLGNGDSFSLSGAEALQKRRQRYRKEKKRVYLERCATWMPWAERPGREEAEKRGEAAPDWPSYPVDSVVKPVIDAAEEAESQRVQDLAAAAARRLQEQTAARNKELNAHLATLLQNQRERDKRRLEEVRHAAAERTDWAKVAVPLREKLAAMGICPGAPKKVVVTALQRPAAGVPTPSATMQESQESTTTAAARSARIDELAKGSLARFGFTIKPTPSRCSSPTASSAPSSTVALSAPTTPPSRPPPK
ncbi:hypothetical protein JCM8097_004642 [Rhodosporidiobolus ruineniae]